MENIFSRMLGRKILPDLLLEKQAKKNGYLTVAGLDEAGRGSWAGPVVAGAVILDVEQMDPYILAELNDSKKLSETKRLACFDKLPSCATIAIGIATVDEIDKLNILRASLLAMERALLKLLIKPDYALVDGNILPELPCLGEPVIKGDNRSYSISAASIVAKVTRDRIMKNLAKKYVEYGWETNVGYGTTHHQRALFEHGVTEYHRKSFRPVNKILSQTGN